MKKVEVSLRINTTPDKVIKAFIDPKMLSDWWSVEKTLIQPKPGGLYILTWNVTDKGFGYVSSGVIKTYDPKKELIIENLVYLNPEKPFLGPMSLTIRVKEGTNGCEVYLCQDGYQEGTNWDWYYLAVKDAWPKVMQEFKKYLEEETSIV